MDEGGAMDRCVWLLGLLAILLLLVVVYGSMGIVASGPGAWVDYLFWAIMGLGTLPAVGLLAWLQLRWLWQCHDRQGQCSPRQRF